MLKLHFWGLGEKDATFSAKDVAPRWVSNNGQLNESFRMIPKLINLAEKNFYVSVNMVISGHIISALNNRFGIIAAHFCQESFELIKLALRSED